MKMGARCLDYTPGPEQMGRVHSVWLEDFKRKGLTDDDVPRVREAFAAVGAKATKWPRPSDVLNALPAKRDQGRKRIGRHMSEREVQANLAKLARLRAEFESGQRGDSDVDWDEQWRRLCVEPFRQRG